MATLKDILAEWYDSTLPRLPETTHSTETKRRRLADEVFNSIPPSELAEDIWAFVRSWLVQNPPATVEETAGRFDGESVLHLEESFAPDVQLVRLSLRRSATEWQMLTEVRVTEGVARYDRRRSELNLRDLAVARSSVRWEVVA